MNGLHRPWFTQPRLDDRERRLGALVALPEDGCLTVYSANHEGTTAFTSFGIENIKELIEIHKADPGIIERHRKLG